MTTWRVLILLLCVSSVAVAQQYPQFSQFNYHLNPYNPAYTGVENQLSVTAQARSQWYGLNGNPFTQALSVHTPIYNIRGGVGITLVNNQQGLQRNTYAGLDYAFIIRKRNHLFSIGIRGGIIQASLDGSKIITPDGVYEGGTINHNDNTLPVGMKNSISPDVAAGVLYYNKSFAIGVSALNLLQPKLALVSGDNGPTLNRNIFGHFSYNIKLSSAVMFRNAFLVKYDFADMQEETNVAFQYKALGWIGAGYRGFQKSNQDAVYALIGIRVSKKWTIGYSYDYTLSALNKVSNGSHEILVNYALELSQIAKPGKFIYTPRF